jgi:hypothetical protein
MLTQQIKKLLLLEIFVFLIKSQASQEKVENPKNNAEFVLLEDLQVLSPLNTDSKIKRAIFRMVC